MVYRTEFTNAAVFEKLQEKIPQVILYLSNRLINLKKRESPPKA